MRNGCILIAFLCTVSFAGYAEYFDGRFEPGYSLLEQGEFDKALENFEQLKTDTPDSELVDYSIASVAYRKAVSLRENENIEGAIEEFSKAKGQFDPLASSIDEFLREHAPLNSANCTSQIAKLYHPEQQYKERVQGLAQALHEYDTFLGQFPGHTVAQRNRDHVSYLLKQLLRNPPPEEEQEQEQEQDGDEDSEDKDDQEQKDQEESEDGDDNPDENNPDDNEQKEGDQDPKDPADAQNNESESSNPQKGQNGKTPEEQNIEAILESLEAKNQEEQKELRKTKTLPRVKGGKWW